MPKHRSPIVVAIAAFIALVVLAFFATAPTGITGYEVGPGNISTNGTPDFSQECALTLDETSL